MFISVAVAVTPSKMLSSAVVKVAPSNISSSVSDISALPIVTVPAKVVLAPLNVTAVVEPDLIIRLPDVFVNEPYCVPPSFNTTSPPSASSVMSPAVSIRTAPSAIKSSCPSVDELINMAVSRNCNFSVDAISISSEN